MNSIQGENELCFSNMFEKVLTELHDTLFDSDSECNESCDDEDDDDETPLLKGCNNNIRYITGLNGKRVNQLISEFTKDIISGINVKKEVIRYVEIDLTDDQPIEDPEIDEELRDYYNKRVLIESTDGEYIELYEDAIDDEEVVEEVDIKIVEVEEPKSNYWFW